MPRRVLLFLLACLGPGIWGAACPAWAMGDVDSGSRFLAAVETAVAAGEISAEEALVYKFAYGFAPETLPVRFRPAGRAPLKCATALIIQYEGMRDRLAAADVKRIDAWLAPAPAGADKAIYNSPGGHFTLTYYTVGTNAVPTTDTTPANGIPDFVEKIAAYCDETWNFEIGTLGFAPPPIGTGRYQINFEAMDYYGYTTPLATPVGATRITLHNTFLGFPPNTDPDGNQWGAAKVTVAHEFKHASQRAGSLWSEGGWVELDATWMEDIAYDIVNDYYNYLPYGSPISAPASPLDNGGAGGSYEDCVFQHWMTETWGNQIIVDFWTWRKTHQTEAVTVSYNQVLGARGSSIALGWPLFTAWNFLTGTRAVAGTGYGEATYYPTGPSTTLTTYPATASGTVAYLAANFVRCAGLPTVPGRVHVQFNGADGSLVKLTAAITRTDGSALLEPVTLNGTNDADLFLTVPLPEIAALGFVVGNGATGGVVQAYTLTITPDPSEALLAVDQTAISLTLVPGGSGTAPLAISNVGEPASLLSYTAAFDGGSVSWLTVTPTAGVLAQGETEVLTLGFAAGSLGYGTYNAVLVIAYDAAGSPASVPVELVVQAPTGADPPRGLFRLAGNRPNPFNPATRASFSLAAAGPVTVEVLDLLGRRVRTLLRAELPAGPATVGWDGRDDAGRAVSSGTYLLRLSSDGQTATRKMMLTR